MPYPLLLHGQHTNPVPTYQPYGAWLVPWRFTTFDEEYQALRTTAALLDVSTQAVVEVQGPDRAGFLQNLLTNDITRLRPGTGCQAALLTSTAKLVAPLLVVAQEDAFACLCEATVAAGVLEHLNRHLFSEQVVLANHERRDAALALEGPRAVDILSHALGTAVALPHPGDHATHRLDGLRVRLIRHALAGDVGVLCLCPHAAAKWVWEFLLARGRAQGLKPAGWEALNAARIEAGRAWFGIDMDDSNLLPETGLEAAVVSDTKGCYLGQEIVTRMRTYGSANKKLVGLRLEEPPVPEPGDRILAAGAGNRPTEALGRVTSACFSPALRCPIGLGYVKRGSYEPGTPVAVERRGRLLRATVTPVNTGTQYLFPGSAREK